MRANREYRLVVARDGSGLRPRRRVLRQRRGRGGRQRRVGALLGLPGRDAAAVGMLEADLALDADEFLGRWAAFE